MFKCQCQTSLGPKIADHSSILVKVPDAVETMNLRSRTIWQFDDVDGHAIERRINCFDWQVLTRGTVDDALEIFTSLLEDLMHAHIPCKTKSVKKSTLPWLNEICYQAIRSKQEAVGLTNYNEVAAQCREVLLGERHKYLDRLKIRMQNLPRSSKRWWSLNKQLLNKQAAPPLFPL